MKTFGTTRYPAQQSAAVVVARPGMPGAPVGAYTP